MLVSYSTCILKGKGFSPKQAEDVMGIKFDVKNEVNEIGIVGKYKGRQVPFGSGTIKSLADKDELCEKYVLNLVHEYIYELKDIGVEEIIFSIAIEYEEQCNFELDRDFITKLASLGVPLGISCYRQTEG